MHTQLHPARGTALPPKKFRPMSVVAKQLDGSKRHLIRSRPRPRPHCVTWGQSSPSQKWYTKWSPISATAEHLLSFVFHVHYTVHFYVITAIRVRHSTSSLAETKMHIGHGRLCLSVCVSVHHRIRTLLHGSRCILEEW